MFGDVRVIPNGFRLLMSVGWLVYLLPILALLFGASSLRFASLQSASVVSFLASLFLVTYVMYAFLLATPMLLNAVPKLERPKTPLQPMRDGAFSSASRSTSFGPAWLNWVGYAATRRS
jgi:phosphoglycerol transferase MdoB-like AlkP superfamily enzyme